MQRNRMWWLNEEAMDGSAADAEPLVDLPLADRARLDTRPHLAEGPGVVVRRQFRVPRSDDRGTPRCHRRPLASIPPGVTSPQARRFGIERTWAACGPVGRRVRTGPRGRAPSTHG